MKKDQIRKRKMQQNGRRRVLARVLSEELAVVTGGTFTQLPDPDGWDTDGSRFAS